MAGPAPAQEAASEAVEAREEALAEAGLAAEAASVAEAEAWLAGDMALRAEAARAGAAVELVAAKVAPAALAVAARVEAAALAEVARAVTAEALAAGKVVPAATEEEVAADKEERAAARPHRNFPPHYGYACPMNAKAVVGFSIGDVAFDSYFLPLDCLASGSFITAAEHPRFGQGWLAFREPVSSLSAWKLSNVGPLLDQVDQACVEGHFAAGYVAYEAAPAFDAALEVQPLEDQPLASFHIYAAPPLFYKELEFSPSGAENWIADIDRETYSQRLSAIHRLLAEGATYQVNFSYRLMATAGGSTTDLFARLVADNPPPYASLFLSDDIEIASLSPELFFELERGTIRCKPMKGTAPRGETSAVDFANAITLQQSVKDQAENLMIVDMIRNDLGRIAKVGSVTTPSLFEVEAFPTVLQMTSTIEAKTESNLHAIFRALFPCASIVGAPKVATMRIIRDLESSPRGVYTGAIGYVAPGGAARFSVAIRTISAPGGSDRLTYGVGSGIVWDSEAESEWEECRLKANVLRRSAEPWALFETLLWTPEEGYALLDLHMARLASAAGIFEIPFDKEAAVARLSAVALGFDDPRRVKLILNRIGELEVRHVAMTPPTNPLRACLADRPIASEDPVLRFKTTRRQVYALPLKEGPADEVLLWNERGEATEFGNGNLVVRFDGRLVTPPLSCGLLNGTFREALVRSDEISERVVTLDDLAKCSGIYLINSVRGWVEIELR